eukprot:gene623-87_t
MALVPSTAATERACGAAPHDAAVDHADGHLRAPSAIPPYADADDASPSPPNTMVGRSACARQSAPPSAGDIAVEWEVARRIPACCGRGAGARKVGQD